MDFASLFGGDVVQQPQANLAEVLTPQLFSQLPPMTPPPQVPANASAFQRFNERLANDPALMRAMIVAGASMLQPRGPGQSSLGHLARSALTGLDAYDTSRFRDVEEARVAAEEQRKREMHDVTMREKNTQASLGEQTLDAKVRNAEALAKKAALDVVQAEREGNVAEVLQAYKLNLARTQGSFDPEILAQNFYAQLMKPVLENATEQEKAAYYRKHGEYFARMPRDPSVTSAETAKKERIEAFKTLYKNDPRFAGKPQAEIDAHALIAATDPNGLQVLHAKQGAAAVQLDPRAQDFVTQFVADSAEKKYKTPEELNKAIGKAFTVSGLQGGIAMGTPEGIAARAKLQAYYFPNTGGAAGGVSEPLIERKDIKPGNTTVKPSPAAPTTSENKAARLAALEKRLAEADAAEPKFHEPMSVYITKRLAPAERKRYEAEVAQLRKDLGK